MEKKRISSDLLIVLVWIIMTFIFVIIPTLSDSIVRIILGIPMALFIPGYVLTGALFPKKDDLEGVERVALSFGLSIAIVPLLGLVLNFTFGIRPIPILLILTLYSVVMVAVANYRIGNLPEGDKFSVPFGKIYKDTVDAIKMKGNVGTIPKIVLILTIVLAIGIAYYVIAIPRVGEKFTEFYILGANREADGYPTKLTVGNSSGVLVGVVNHEYSDVNYTVQIALNNDTLVSKNLLLVHNQIWEENMTFISNKNGDNMKLEFWLFKDNNLTVPYRELHLWVNSVT